MNPASSTQGHGKGEAMREAIEKHLACTACDEICPACEIAMRAALPPRQESDNEK